MPYLKLVLNGFGLHVIGIVAHSPAVDLGTIRLLLADGSVFEDPVSDGSTLLFVQLRSPLDWAAEAICQILDRQGEVISSAKHWVHPFERPLHRHGDPALGKGSVAQVKPDGTYEIVVSDLTTLGNAIRRVVDSVRAPCHTGVLHSCCMVPCHRDEERSLAARTRHRERHDSRV